MICYKHIKMVISFITYQDNISNTVIHHVKRIRSLSKYYASHTDNNSTLRLIGLKDKENTYKEGPISPTPSLSTTSTTTSVASLDYQGGHVAQMIHLFESGQLYQYNKSEKRAFIMERRFDYDPTATEWKKRTVKSKFI
ncbi:hypothetical protein K501DRAFT_328874 [Backusella circina FSU 941]|nr:hypothetical protein K501DRAFT_328874 [Backusella circina FSU 941]